MAGIVGAAVGVAAAGSGGRRRRPSAPWSAGSRPTRPTATRDEPFGEQRYDEAFRLELPDGTDIHVEVVEPTRPVPGRPDGGLVHGFCLDMGTFHFQRQVLAARGDYRIVATTSPVTAGPAGWRPASTTSPCSAGRCAR